MPTPDVRGQYEEYPFPARDPRDERRRLIAVEQEALGKLNHYCFAGRQSFGGGFRVLVAGGGTGDHTVFLAEQLRQREAGVTYLDFSRASMKIARARAEARGLDNIEWLHGSILDLPEMGLGPFDLISCTGVLHHLPDPDAGLAALRRVLAPDGAMSLMLYGWYGRMGIYAAQDLMALVNEGEEDRGLKARAARAVLSGLPDTHWLLRGGDRERQLAVILDDDANLYDLLLHEQDRAYTVTDIYELLDANDLELVEFTSFLCDVPTFRYLYEPAVFIRDPELLARIAELPRRRQQAIAEAVSCAIPCHGFYAAPKAAGCVASPEALEMVPYYLAFDGGELASLVGRSAGRALAFRHRHSTVHFTPGRWSGPLLEAMDGARSLAEMFDAVRSRSGAPVARQELWEDFMAAYRPLNSLDVILLRHRSVPPFPELPVAGAGP